MKTKDIFLITFIAALILILNPGLLSAQKEGDTIEQKVLSLGDRISGIEERITNAENDLYKLTKIKLSGYIQAQWEHFENPSVYPDNYFSLRRARFKVQYEPVSGVCFVLQPDFIPSGVSVKDAYVQINEPWLKTFSLWGGLFNRPNYEVEYSSSQREVPERSRVIRALYPGERALGAKLEVAPQSLPLKVQFAVLNGNDYMTIRDGAGVNINPSNKDFDPYKDMMGRVTYNFRLGNFGGLDLGIHGYYGWLKSNSPVTLKSDYTFDKSVTVGSSVNRQWLGAELQFYADILGGLSIKGEFIFGLNAYPGSTLSTTVTDPVKTSIENDTLFLNNLTTKTSTVNPAISRNFMGYYVYLIKNIGKKNQLAIRWDYYDPNTKLKSDEIGIVKYDDSKSESKTTTNIIDGTPTIVINNTTETVTKQTLKSGVNDIAYGTLTLAWNYYLSDNIRIQLAYEMPFNEKVGVNADGVGNVTQTYTVNDIKGVLDYSKVYPQNVLTLRLQARF